MTAGMRTDPLSFLGAELDALRAQGLHRTLRVLDGHQAARATVDGSEVVNLSPNNHSALRPIQSPKKALAASNGRRRHWLRQNDRWTCRPRRT